MSSCRDESEQGVITVTNYDNSLVQTTNFWLDIVLDICTEGNYYGLR